MVLVWQRWCSLPRGLKIFLLTAQHQCASASTEKDFYHRNHIIFLLYRLASVLVFLGVFFSYLYEDVRVRGGTWTDTERWTGGRWVKWRSMTGFGGIWPQASWATCGFRDSETKNNWLYRLAANQCCEEPFQNFFPLHHHSAVDLWQTEPLRRCWETFKNGGIL